MGEDKDIAGSAAWLTIGQRNILYLAFVSLLGPFSLALDGPRLSGTDPLGGKSIALLVCVLVSLVFFVVNAGLAVADLKRGRRAAKALLGCALPAIFGFGAELVRGWGS